MTRKNYHHGALREALLRATLTLIEDEGIGAVSLRRVARAAGVSPGAPYHHFEDRGALLRALSDEGFENLTRTLRTAHDAAATPTEALEAILNAYVHFAQDNPAHFRLMFRPELKQSKTKEKEPNTSEESYEILETTIKNCKTANALVAADEEVLAITLWSLVHGLASLWLDNQLTHKTKPAKTLAQEVTALITKLTKN